MDRNYRYFSRMSAILILMSVGRPANAADTLSILDAPYWRSGEGFQTTVMMNNTRPKTMTITLYVYNDKGESLSSPPFTIGPMASKSVSLSDVLSSGFSKGTGYLELQFQGAPVDIAAQALVQDPSHGVRWNHVFESKKRYLSSRYEGVFMGGVTWKAQHLP